MDPKYTYQHLNKSQYKFFTANPPYLLIESRANLATSLLIQAIIQTYLSVEVLQLTKTWLKCMDIQLLTTGKGEQGIGLQEDSLGGTESVAPLISPMSQT